MSKMVRKTVTLPAETVAAVEELSGGNFSAYTAQALGRAVRRENLRLLLEDLIAEHGPVDPAERAKVDAQWQR